jgi:hypothetical protein
MKLAWQRMRSYVAHHATLAAVLVILTVIGLLAVIYFLLTNEKFQAALLVTGQAIYDLAVSKIAPLVLFILAIANVFYLIRYVRTTAQIAESNRRAADATLQAAQATQESAKLSQLAVAEMQATRDAQTAPYVVVYIELINSLVTLVMENLGATAAYNVSLEFDPPLPPDVFLGVEPPAFVSGVTPTLSPRQQMRRIMIPSAAFETLEKQNVSMRYRATVEYKGGPVERERVRNEEFIIDIASFSGVTLPNSQLEQTVKEGSSLVLRQMEESNRHLEALQRKLGDGLTITRHWLRPHPSADHLSDFRARVGNLTSEMRVWSAKEQSVGSVSTALMRDRLRFAAAELLATASYLPESDETIDEVRSLAFDLQAAAQWLHWREDRSSMPVGAINRLQEIADSVQPTAGGDVHGQSAATGESSSPIDGE